MAWEGAKGIESPVGEGVEGVGLSWLSSSIFSFSVFMYVLCDVLHRSCLLGSFVTFCDVLFMFILRTQRKRVEIKMDTIFEHPVFDSTREKMKRLKETFGKALCTCFKCGATMFFLFQNRSGLPMKERLY